jgi:hypothetical protein
LGVTTPFFASFLANPGFRNRHLAHLAQPKTLSGWWLTYPPEKYYTLLHFIGRPQGSVYAPAAQPEKY